MNNSIPYPANESARLEALKSYEMLDTPSEEDFDDLTRLASEICGTPVALITLLDENRQWFKSSVGINVTETPREYAFCSHTITEPSGMMQINDARKDHRFVQNPLVTGETNIVFYAGVSLVDKDGLSLGSLCVIDTKPRELSSQQSHALQVISKQVIAQMELRKKVRKLREANRVLSETNEFMQRFATSAAHDLKNPLSSISMSAELLIRHLEKTKDEKGIKMASTNLASAKKLTNLVNDMLDYSLRPEILTRNHTSIHLKSFLDKTISMISMPAHVQITILSEECNLRTSEVALQQIFINLLTNAVRYNDKATCKIEIDCKKERDLIRFTVSDNGIGIPENALTRIFEKNYTLNESDCFKQNSTGIGLYTVRFLVEKLGGEISVTSSIGEGSRFTFSIYTP